MLAEKRANLTQNGTGVADTVVARKTVFSFFNGSAIGKVYVRWI